MVARSISEGEVNTPVIRSPRNIEIGSDAGQGTTPDARSSRHARGRGSSQRLSCQPPQGWERVVSCFWSARPVFAGQDARAMPCSAGLGGAIMVRRMNPVMPTAMAPAIAKITCQVSDGMVSFTMPKVAW